MIGFVVYDGVRRSRRALSLRTGSIAKSQWPVGGDAMSRDNVDDGGSTSRRKFLRNAGLAAGATTLTPAVAAANDRGNSSKSNERDATVLNNNKRVKKWKYTTDDGRTFIYRLHKNANNSIEYKEVSDPSIEQEKMSSSERIGTYDRLLDRTNVIKRRIGSCSSNYKDHAYVAASLDFGEDLSSLSSSVVSGAICGLLGFVAGPIGSYIGGVVCGAAATILVNSISGTSATVGLFDNDNYYGFFPQVVAGTSGEYNAEVNDLNRFSKNGFVHVSAAVSV